MNSSAISKREAAAIGSAAEAIARALAKRKLAKFRALHEKFMEQRADVAAALRPADADGDGVLTADEMVAAGMVGKLEAWSVTAQELDKYAPRGETPFMDIFWTAAQALGATEVQ